MISLVIVCHSRPLAEALVALARQMAGETVPIAMAAGAGAERELFGTDAAEILAAIQSVYRPEGVLVLMDLGSAVLAAEMAVEMLPEEMQSQVRLCAAPLVEGTIAASVQAGLGGDLDSLCREARRSLEPKFEHLGQPTVAVTVPPPVAGEAADRIEKQITLKLSNPHGLHARPAARLVRLAASFEAEIQVENLTRGKGPAPARSLNALATLGAVEGDEVRIRARGPQAEAALQALRGLIEDRFGEGAPITGRPAASRAVRQSPPAGALPAIPIAEGIALGPLQFYRAPVPVVPHQPTADPQGGWENLERAWDTARDLIRQQRRDLASRQGEEEAAIFDAHLLILDDPQLRDRVRELVFGHRRHEAEAWQTAVAETARTYQDLDDPYLRQRAADVLGVGSLVLRALLGEEAGAELELAAPSILWARDLTPTQVARLDPERVLGLITVAGSPSSHSSILARGMGIPAVAGVSPVIEDLPAGTLIGMDGAAGTVWIDPDAATQATLRDRRRSWLEERTRRLELSQEQARTRDGHPVEVAANVGRVLDATLALRNGAEAIGVVRTEFLFLTRRTPPTEDEQMAALRAIGSAMGSRSVIVRTLDVGGDKSLPYLQMPAEANPFLGTRAIRLSLREPGLFRTQLRAILRAGADCHLRIMFPMVTLVEELTRARTALAAAHAELQAEGLPHRWPIETGIMVETPAAALLSPAFARQVDFLSLGTNDLVQYTLAAERGNPELAPYADGLHPAILRLIRRVVVAAHREGKWAGVCGELAGDLVAVPILVGLGVDELSLNPAGIPLVKARLRNLDYAAARELAEQALAADDAPTVRRLAAELGLPD